MEARKLKAVEIAEAGNIRQRGTDLWLVPSQSHSGKWMVDYSEGEPTCTCPDYEKRSAFCKHIFAIEIHERRLTVSPENPDQPKKYTQDWPAYRLAQINEGDHFHELLHALCDGITMPPQTGRGRPKTPLADVVFASALKVYSGMSGRRAESYIRRAAEQGLLSKTVPYNTISDYMKNPELTPLLRTLLQESALPLKGIERRFAVDSSGFSTKSYVRWFDHKWGKSRKEKKWVKAHAICGDFTHIVTDLIISSKGDATQFKPLLDRTAARFHVEEISADKAYLSRKNMEAAAAHGAIPYIPFKAGTTGKAKGSEMWRKMWLYYEYKREDFDRHYHQRSNVETLFAMIKMKFGGSVRSKDEIAQANELYLKYLCHNICVLISSIYELGIQPEFWRDEGAV